MSTTSQTTPKNFDPNPFPYHEELKVKISGLTNLGKGIAKVDGWVVMVPFVIPGEEARVRIYRNYKNYSDADLIEILEPSESRVDPKCSLFGECGGCQYQHVSYETQLENKRLHVAEVMKKIGELTLDPNPPIHSEHQYHYRSKITPHYQKPKNGVIGPIGFLAHGKRHQIIDVERCPIAQEPINEKLPEIRTDRMQRVKKTKSKKGETLLLRNAIEGVTDDFKAVITETVSGIHFQFKAGDFFQNNPYVLPEMVNWAIRKASEAGSELFIDAYCGSGLFALSAAAHFDKIIGIEVSESSVQWARANAQLNQISNARFVVGDAANIFGTLDMENGSEAVLLIDPPRKGCDEAFLEQMICFGPKRVVYVSCDPATQARDLKYCAINGYRITELQPVDLFPQTRHIENIAVLVKES